MHLIQVRHFRAFFTGRHSAKESATCFQANFLTVSQVALIVGMDMISELEVAAEGCACTDKVDKDSEWVVLVA